MPKKNTIDYDTLLDRATLGIVKEVLKIVEQKGLPSDHHFYITFKTNAKGVVMPDELRAKYKDEMTIVLQYEFDRLSVLLEGFAVFLIFEEGEEELFIPFAAITCFNDPSADFVLHFRNSDNTDDESGTAGSVISINDLLKRK